MMFFLHTNLDAVLALNGMSVATVVHFNMRDRSVII